MEELERTQAEARLQALEAAVLADVEQFGACSLAEKLKVQRLGQAVQEKLSQIRALTRDLELLFEELDSDEERQHVAGLLTRHKAEYERIQRAYKEAALAQRRRGAAAAAEERRELLAGAADPAARQRALVAQGELVAASEGVTEGLRRTRHVLAEQLDHTGATLAAMEQSHTQLGKTKDEYGQQAGLLKQSKGLLGTLNWQANAERWLLWIGLAVFMAVVAYIVQKRVGYFVPHAIKPSTLVGSAAGYFRSAPKAPAGAPLPPHVLQPQQHAVGVPGEAPPLSQPPPAEVPLAPAPGEAPGLPPHFAHRDARQQAQQEQHQQQEQQPQQQQPPRHQPVPEQQPPGHRPVPEEFLQPQPLRVPAPAPVEAPAPAEPATGEGAEPPPSLLVPPPDTPHPQVLEAVPVPAPEQQAAPPQQRAAGPEHQAAAPIPAVPLAGAPPAQPQVAAQQQGPAPVAGAPVPQGQPQPQEEVSEEVLAARRAAFYARRAAEAAAAAEAARQRQQQPAAEEVREEL